MMAGVLKRHGMLRGPRGTEGKQGKQGLPGLEAVPTGEGIAAHLVLDGPARDAFGVAMADVLDTPGEDFTREQSRRTLSAVHGDGLDSAAVAAFRAGRWTAEGAAVTARAALLSSDAGAVAGGVMETTPAYSQLLTNSDFAGATPGIISGTTGATTGVQPTGWAHFQSTVDKRLEAGTGGGRIVWTSLASSGVSFGGWRSTVPFTPNSDVVVSFEATIEDVPLDKEVNIIVAFHNASNGQVEGGIGGQFGQVIHSSKEPQQGRRVTVVLPNPGGARSLVIYAGSLTGQTNTGVQPRITIERILVSHASEVGIDPFAQPPYFSPAGTRPARDVVLNVPAGNYHVVGRTEGGRVRGGAAIVADTGLSVRGALGAGRFTDVWVLTPGSYQRADVEALARTGYASAVLSRTTDSALNFSTQLASFALRRPLGPVSQTAEARSPSHGLQVATNYPGLSRYEVRPGEVSPGDGNTQERAELAIFEPYPYGGEFVTAGWFTADELEPSSPGFSPRPIPVKQLRYVLSPDPGANPEFTVNMYPRTVAGRWGLQFRGVTSGVVASSASALSVLSNGAGTNLWEFDLGEWVYIVTRTKFAPSGVGRVEVWINRTGAAGAQELILDYTGPLGYTGPVEFRYRSGLYASNWPTTRRARHFMPRFGPSTQLDAVALATFPPPLLIR